MTQFLIATKPNGTKSDSDQVIIQNVTFITNSIPLLPFEFSLAPRLVEKSKRYRTVGSPFCGHLSRKTPIFGLTATNQIASRLVRPGEDAMTNIQISNHTDTSIDVDDIQKPSLLNTRPADANDLPYCCMELYTEATQEQGRVKREDVQARMYCKAGSQGGSWIGLNNMLPWDELDVDMSTSWLSHVRTGQALGPHYRGRLDRGETFLGFFTSSIGSIGTRNKRRSFHITVRLLYLEGLMQCYKSFSYCLLQL